MTDLGTWQEALLSDQICGRPDTVHIWPAKLCIEGLWLLVLNFACGEAVCRAMPEHVSAKSSPCVQARV